MELSVDELRRECSLVCNQIPLSKWNDHRGRQAVMGGGVVLKDMASQLHGHPPLGDFEPAKLCFGQIFKNQNERDCPKTIVIIITMDSKSVAADRVCATLEDWGIWSHPRH